MDAFQGREVDLVFYSTVRTGTAYGVGFVSDIRRMNVSFTRPRFGLFVVGNEVKLRTSKYWNQFIEFTRWVRRGGWSCRARNRVINISDINIDLEKAIRDNIKLHSENNLYANYQSRHKKLELSLYESVEETYATKEGRYSPEVIVTSHSPVCNTHAIKQINSHLRISCADH